jgi:hypothetical protein
MPATDKIKQASGLIVCVQHHPRGCWEVNTADGRGPIPCETLDDARRIAYLAVARTQRCELIVRDAYHRVIEHEVLEGHPRPSRANR